MKEKEQKANAELTKEFQKVDNELAEIIRAGKPAINSDNFRLQEEAERGEALNKRVNETAAYHNALRNERGSLAVPEAVSDAEAVNKKQLETHVSEKIAELVGGAPGTLDTLKEIADALNGEAGIVNTLTQEITKAQAEAVKTAKEEATQYTNSKLENYYTKAEVNESQRVQDARIKTLEDASLTSGAGAFYDFSQAEAVKTGETIKLADGTVKDIYRLCVERENVGIDSIILALPTTSKNILNIKGIAYSTLFNTTLENAFSVMFSDTDRINCIPKVSGRNFESVKIIIDFLA